MDPISNDPRYDEARRHVQAVRGFYSHAVVYAVVNIGLFGLNLLTSPGRWWFGWPALGWGIGLAFHALAVFAFHGWFGAEWEQRKIREYLDRHR